MKYTRGILKEELSKSLSHNNIICLNFGSDGERKQDDGLDDLSNILGDLKGMALGMGTELNRLVCIYIYIYIKQCSYHMFSQLLLCS